MQQVPATKILLSDMPKVGLERPQIGLDCWMCRKEGQRLSCGKCRSIYYIVQRGANNSIGNSDIKTCVANLLLSH